MNIRKIRIAAVCLLTLSGVLAAKEPYLKNVQLSDSGDVYTCTWKNTERKFSLFLPQNNPKGIFIMLHGAGQTIQAFKSLTRMESAACPAEYAVCYVSSGKEGTWNAGSSVSSKDDLGFINDLARYFQTRFELQKKDTFLCGFSNGAFMTHYTALQKKSPFGSIIAVAGLAPNSTWNKSRQNYNCNILQVYGTKDDLVISNNDAKPNVIRGFPYIEEVQDFWIKNYKLDMNSSENFGNNSLLTKYENNSRKVWILKINNYPHQWPSSRTTGYELTDLILDFVR